MYILVSHFLGYNVKQVRKAAPKFGMKNIAVLR